MRNSVLERWLFNLQLETSVSEREVLCGYPYHMHEMLFTSYSDNWRWYFRHLGSQFEKKVDKLKCSSNT